MAHCLLGAVQISSGRAATGIAACERALALDRNLAAAHGYIAGAKYFNGQAEETETHVKEALRLSPIDTNAYLWINLAGFAKLALGADEEAITNLRRRIEANRNSP